MVYRFKTERKLLKQTQILSTHTSLELLPRLLVPPAVVSFNLYNQEIFYS